MRSAGIGRAAATTGVALLLMLAAPISPEARFTEEPTESGEAPGAEAAAGRAAALSGDYVRAVRHFRAAAAETPGDADVWSMLGFSLRKSGEVESSLFAYDRALAIDPAHLDALAYLGEAYLQLGEAKQAQALLARLDEACRIAESASGAPPAGSSAPGCPQRGDLAHAMDAAAKNGATGVGEAPGGW